MILKGFDQGQILKVKSEKLKVKSGKLKIIFLLFDSQKEICIFDLFAGLSNGCALLMQGIHGQQKLK